jgi:hypothetical protein
VDHNPNAPNQEPRDMADKVQRTYTLPEPLVARIEQEAAARGVDPAWFVTRILTETLDRLIPATEFRLTAD